MKSHDFYKIGQRIDNQQEQWMIYLINFHTLMIRENLHILEWKTFIISAKEIIGKKIKLIQEIY